MIYLICFYLVMISYFSDIYNCSYVFVDLCMDDISCFGVNLVKYVYIYVYFIYKYGL